MEEKTLQIYFTSDLHAFIYPTDYRSAEERDFDSVRADGAHTDTRAFAFLFVAVHFVSSFCLIV